MNILILGNGFDLAHNLPTKYKDFLDFIRYIHDYYNYKNIESTIRCAKASSNYSFINYFENIFDPNNYSIFEKLNTAYNKNFWIKYFLNLSKASEGWIDFESEICKIIKIIDEVKRNNVEYTNYDERKRINDQLSNRYHDILIFIHNNINLEFSNSDSFRKYTESDYNNIIDCLEKDLLNLIECLNIYLCEVVNNLEVDLRCPDILNTKFDKILSFNYTNTYQRLYDIDSKSEYHYIHGKATMDSVDNNIVLGIDDYLKGDYINTEVDFISFKKYFQRIYKKTGAIYKDWISFDDTNVFIVGHSLDSTDKDILKEIINNKNVTTTIYYHDPLALKCQIANLVKVIGRDPLISKVYDLNPRIIFKPLEKAVKSQ